MLSKVLLVSLFVAVAVAAPAPSIREVPCPSVTYPEGINPAPSASVILLNSPSGVGRIAGPQGPPVINLSPPAPAPNAINLNPPAPSPTVGNLNAPEAPPSVINLNAGAPSPSVINLNRRQLSPLPPTSSFSFGGIVPSSIPSGTPNSSFGGIVAASSFSPPPTATPSPGASDNTATFSSVGPDGVKTVLLLSATTVTVSGAACSSAPAFNPSQGAFVPPVSPTIAPSSAFGANVQAPPAAPSSPSIINLNSPPATVTPAPGSAAAPAV